MKVVFDTNIFVSALVIPGSQAEKAVLRIIEGHDVLLLSKEILDELLSILSSKFSRDKEEISRVAVASEAQKVRKNKDHWPEGVSEGKINY